MIPLRVFVYVDVDGEGEVSSNRDHEVAPRDSRAVAVVCSTGCTVAVPPPLTECAVAWQVKVRCHKGTSLYSYGFTTSPSAQGQQAFLLRHRSNLPPIIRRNSPPSLAVSSKSTKLTKPTAVRINPKPFPYFTAFPGQLHPETLGHL